MGYVSARGCRLLLALLALLAALLLALLTALALGLETALDVVSDPLRALGEVGGLGTRTRAAEAGGLGRGAEGRGGAGGVLLGALGVLGLGLERAELGLVQVVVPPPVLDASRGERVGPEVLATDARTLAVLHDVERGDAGGVLEHHHVAPADTAVGHAVGGRDPPEPVGSFGLLLGGGGGGAHGRGGGGEGDFGAGLDLAGPALGVGQVDLGLLLGLLQGDLEVAGELAEALHAESREGLREVLRPRPLEGHGHLDRAGEVRELVGGLAGGQEHCEVVGAEAGEVGVGEAELVDQHRLGDGAEHDDLGLGDDLPHVGVVGGVLAVSLEVGVGVAGVGAGGLGLGLTH